MSVLKEQLASISWKRAALCVIGLNAVRVDM